MTRRQYQSVTEVLDAHYTAGLLAALGKVLEPDFDYYMPWQEAIRELIAHVEATGTLPEVKVL